MPKFFVEPMETTFLILLILLSLSLREPSVIFPSDDDSSIDDSSDYTESLRELLVCLLQPTKVNEIVNKINEMNFLFILSSSLFTIISK